MYCPNTHTRTNRYMNKAKHISGKMNFSFTKCFTSVHQIKSIKCAAIAFAYTFVLWSTVEYACNCCIWREQWSSVWVQRIGDITIHELDQRNNHFRAGLSDFFNYFVFFFHFHNICRFFPIRIVHLLCFGKKNSCRHTNMSMDTSFFCFTPIFFLVAFMCFSFVGMSLVVFFRNHFRCWLFSCLSRIMCMMNDFWLEIRFMSSCLLLKQNRNEIHPNDNALDQVVTYGKRD